MWVNVDNIDDLKEQLEALYGEFKEPIVLSFNTTKTYQEVNQFLFDIKQLDIPIIVGPQFCQDGFIINGKKEFIEELYFATKAEIIIWYLKHFTLPIKIDKIILIDKVLGIDPLIMKFKDNKMYECYFLYEKMEVSTIVDLVNEQIYHFRRLKREKK